MKTCPLSLPFAFRMQASIASDSVALPTSFVHCPFRKRRRSSPVRRNFTREERSKTRPVLTRQFPAEYAGIKQVGLGPFALAAQSAGGAADIGPGRKPGQQRPMIISPGGPTECTASHDDFRPLPRLAPRVRVRITTSMRPGNGEKISWGKDSDGARQGETPIRETCHRRISLNPSYSTVWHVWRSILFTKFPWPSLKEGCDVNANGPINATDVSRTKSH